VNILAHIVRNAFVDAVAWAVDTGKITENVGETIVEVAGKRMANLAQDFGAAADLEALKTQELEGEDWAPRFACKVSACGYGTT